MKEEKISLFDFGKSREKTDVFCPENNPYKTENSVYDGAFGQILAEKEGV